ncbi:hypothetical protein CN918_27120 [Priestia megaterium]|nr:hypothetical protein CN918_27120 [Priestia megaterium]
MDHILKRLIKEETVDEKKYIYFMLTKYSQQLIPVKDKHTYTPLFYVHNRNIHLIYEDEEFGIKSIFTKYDEILIILQMLLNEGKDIFFLYENDEDILEKQDILKKIDESLDANNEAMFYEYSDKLKSFTKGDNE